MRLALGTCSPEAAWETLACAHECGLKDSILVDELYSDYSVLGRYPVLQISPDFCVFGLGPVCDYFRAVARKSDAAAPPVGDGRSANTILSVAIRDAIARAFPLLPTPVRPEVKFNEQGKKTNGDYAFSNCAQLSQVLKPACASPADLAKRISANLDLEQLSWVVDRVEVVGFYVNFFLAPRFLCNKINQTRCVRAPVLKSKRIVVDFSSPNIAKEMHVGHLRSTIIGDSISRLLSFAGHQVLKVNHVGDWGTQFGMLLTYLFQNISEDEQTLLAALDLLSLGELTKLYKQSKQAFDADEAFKTASRHMVVQLQNSKQGAKVRNVWEKLVEVSKRGFDSIYSRLNVNFDNADPVPGLGYCGESFYQDQIDAAIASVKSLTTKRGEAVLLFTGLPEAKQPPSEDNPDGEIPLFLRKSDGGFGYDSTDLAACKFRIQVLGADQIIYVTDAGQSLHFSMIFKAAELAKWTKNGLIELDHCKFGVVTAKGGTKFKTRDGDTVTLASLIDAAQDKMREILLQRQEENAFSPEQIELLSQAIGVAAIKYFDLRNNRTKDYGFDLELMCSPVGDTGVYLMYCYARVCSILDKGDGSSAVAYDWEEHNGAPPPSARERSVALALSRFNEVVAGAVEHLTPHPLCAYLYGLASEFSTFVTDDAERVWAKRDASSVDEPLRLEANRGKQRYVLCKAMKTVLFEGLGLLGIVPFNRM